MNQSAGSENSLIESVLHPTDFSKGSLVAFYHALKAAIVARSELTLLHVSHDGDSAWSDFPGVRETLERWGELPKGSPRSAVSETLGIDVRKVVGSGDPVKSVIQYLETHPAEMIVLATSQRGGHIPWLEKSVATPITLKSEEMTLVIPGDSEGFVSAEDGSVKLTRILIPIAHSPRAEPALKAAARFVQRLNCNEGTFILFHVGDADSAPSIRCPKVEGWSWQPEIRSGDVIEGIVNAAADLDAGLVVMATDGRNGFLDGLRGSHSERVLRHVGVPLLTIPENSYISQILG